MGFVFQFYNLVQNLTALENVELAAQICTVMTRSAMAVRAWLWVMTMTVLPTSLQVFCKSFLDFNTGKAVLKLLQNTCREVGKTVIVITHNQKEVHVLLVEAQCGHQAQVIEPMLSQITQCVLDSGSFGKSVVGSVIRLSRDNARGDLEHFAHREYTVVGLVQSPLYIQAALWRPPAPSHPGCGCPIAPCGHPPASRCPPGTACHTGPGPVPRQIPPTPHQDPQHAGDAQYPEAGVRQAAGDRGGVRAGQRQPKIARKRPKLDLISLKVVFPIPRIGSPLDFRNIHYIPVQNLTALENVELAAQICRNPLDAGEVLDQVGLKDRKGNFPAQLSGGEQQRVAIARALAKNPRMVVFPAPEAPTMTQNSPFSISKSTSCRAVISTSPVLYTFFTF